MKKRFLSLLLLICFLSGLCAGEKLVIKDGDDLAGYIAEYNKLTKLRDKGRGKMEDADFSRYRALEKAINAYFHKNPEAFMKINVNIYDPEAFAFAILPETREVNKYYCEILRAIISNMKCSSYDKMHFFENWCLGRMAGFDDSLRLIDFMERNYCQTVRHPLANYVKRIKLHNSMYEEFKSMDDEKASGWSVFYVYYEEEYCRALIEFRRRREEIAMKYYKKTTKERIEQVLKTGEPEILTEEQYEKLKEEINALKKELKIDFYNELDSRRVTENPASFKEIFMPFAKDRLKPVDLNIPQFFHYIYAEGDRVPRNPSGLPFGPAPIVIIFDQNNIARYMFDIYSKHGQAPESFWIYNLIYDDKGTPVDMIESWVHVRNPEFKDFFAKKLSILIPKDNIFENFEYEVIEDDYF